MNHAPHRQFRAWWLLAIAPCWLSGASDVASSPVLESTAKLNEYIVSSSRVSEIASSASSPVETITAEELQQSGAATSLQEALKSIVPQFMGGGNRGAEGGTLWESTGHDYGGGSSIALRGLSTLVLINGRRAAVSPIAAHGGGTEFVDLNIIPLFAIRSVEILRDGGSAAYGTDAIGGVVNLTTSRVANGGSIGGFYQTAPQNGGWKHRGANYSFGHVGRRTRFLIAGGWGRSDPLWADQRSFSNPLFGTDRLGGKIRIGEHHFALNPALAKPPISAIKPAVAFPMTKFPMAPDGRHYFGVVGSNAVYWGKQDGAGAIIGFSGTDLTQGTPAAAQVALNLASSTTLLQQRETHAGILTIEHEINERWSAFADVLFAHVKTFSQFSSQGFGRIVPGSNANNPFDLEVDVTARILSAPRQSYWDTKFGRLVAGLRGRVGEGIHFETALSANRSRLNFVGPGLIDKTVMGAAVDQARLNLFEATLSPESASSVLGTATNTFVSRLHSWDGRAWFETVALPAGKARWTFGAEQRWETLDGIADRRSIANTRNSNTTFGGGAIIRPFSGTRAVSALFATVKVPILSPQQEMPWVHRFDLTLDTRAERYSDMSDPMVPRAGWRWMPFGREFTLRGGVARSFNAPTLYHLNGPPEAFLSVFTLTGLDGQRYQGQVELQGVSNPKLKPHWADSVTLGLAYESTRWKGLSVELDYVHVRQRSAIGRVPAVEVLQDAELRGAESPYVAGHAQSLPSFDLRLDKRSNADAATVTAPGQVARRLGSVSLNNPLVNLGSREVEALDLVFKYRTGWTAHRLFDATLRVAHTLSHRYNDSETVGHATMRSGTIPRWIAVSMVNYRHGNWRFSLLGRSISSVFADLDGFETGSYQTYNVGVCYRFGQPAPALLRNLDVSLTVKNVADVSPRLAPLTFTFANADIGTYDPIGRTWVMAANYRF
jgi:iron complex outermembrane receptor protein